MKKIFQLPSLLALISAPLIMACGSAQTLITVDEIPVARCGQEQCEEILKRLRSGETVTVKSTSEDSTILLDNEVIYIYQVSAQANQYIAESFIKVEHKPLPQGKQLLQLNGIWYEKAESQTPSDQDWLHPMGSLGTNYFPLRGGCEGNEFVFGVSIED